MKHQEDGMTVTTQGSEDKKDLLEPVLVSALLKRQSTSLKWFLSFEPKRTKKRGSASDLNIKETVVYMQSESGDAHR